MDTQVITAESGEHFSITRAGESVELGEVDVIFEHMPLADIADEVIYSDERIASLRKAIDEATLYKKSLQHELYRRMQAANATALPSVDYVIEYKQSKKLEKNEFTFKEIEFLTEIPAHERAEMVSVVQPPPQVKTDAAALKKYAKKYGGALAEIMSRALRYVDGPIEVVVQRRAPELPE
jgi:hypothetical protein